MMNGKEALDKLFMAVDEELLYEQCGVIFATELTKVIEKDLDRLEQLEKENTELKQLVKEQFEKIQRDSGKMASMDCELRRLKGEFIPQECEG